MAVRLGIDTGGTFTDLIGIDDATGELIVAKTPSTPARPVDAIVRADGETVGAERRDVGRSSRRGSEVVRFGRAGGAEHRFVRRG